VDLAEALQTGIAELVTVALVAGRARVSRSWIYTQPALLDRIRQLQQHHASAGVVREAVTRASDDSLRQRLALAHERINQTTHRKPAIPRCACARPRSTRSSPNRSWCRGALLSFGTPSAHNMQEQANTRHVTRAELGRYPPVDPALLGSGHSIPRGPSDKGRQVFITRCCSAFIPEGLLAPMSSVSPRRSRSAPSDRTPCCSEHASRSGSVHNVLSTRKRYDPCPSCPK
jgi:hypothetical protein